METTPISLNKAAQCLLFFLLTNLMLTSSLVAKAEQQEKVSAMASEIVANNPCPRDELISILIKRFNTSASRDEFLSGIDAAGYIDSAIRNYHKSLIKK